MANLLVIKQVIKLKSMNCTSCYLPDFAVYNVRLFFCYIGGGGGGSAYENVDGDDDDDDMDDEEYEEGDEEDEDDDDDDASRSVDCYRVNNCN